MVRENIKERKERRRRSDDWTSSPVYVVPVADNLSVILSLTVDSYSDLAIDWTQLNGQLHQTEGKLS
jgi:hypothetical protein